MKKYSIPVVIAFLMAVPCARLHAATIKPFGFSHLLWTYSDNDDLEITKKLLRARIGVQGLLTNKMDYMLLMECGSSTYFNPMTLLDAWVNYKVNPALNIKVGQTWYKFTLTGTCVLPKIPFINRPQIVNSMWLPMGRNGSYGYDKGVEIWGNIKDSSMPWGYYLFVTPGTGLDNFDDNSTLDYSVRGYIVPSDGLQLGASAFLGQSRVDLVSAAGNVEEDDVPELAAGVEVSYKRGKYRVIYEYLQGKYDSASLVSSGQTYSIAEQKPMGMYLTFGYMLLESLETLARYDIFNADTSIDDSELNTLTLGITWWLKGAHPLNNVKFNYMTYSAGDNYGTAPDDLLAMELQLAF